MKTNILKFVLDGKIVEIDFTKTNFRPSTTVLNYLRSLPGHRGTKEGCAEGDCGACTVVVGELSEGNKISYKTVDSCMMFLASLHGKQLITVENLAQQKGTETILHPVQKAIVEKHASQCGYCTPGVTMSIFGMYKSNVQPTRENIVGTLSGNLCRCTGYESIFNAAKSSCSDKKSDHFTENEAEIIELLKKIKSGGLSLEVKHPKQEYYLPENLKDTAAIRKNIPDAFIINGSTDTAIKQNKKHEFIEKILDISAVPELKEIKVEPNGFYIGAGATIEQVKIFAENSIPELTPILSVFASQQIRNMASIGGNICTASPIGDTIPLMFALKAKFEITSADQNRWVDAEDFIVGYRKNCLKPNELLKGIFIPNIENDTRIVSEKVSNRRDLDISTVSLAMRIKTGKDGIIQEIILAYGGMAEVAKRAANTEKQLVGKKPTRENIMRAMEQISNDFKPISDARANKEYRISVAGNLLLKILGE